MHWSAQVHTAVATRVSELQKWRYLTQGQRECESDSPVDLQAFPQAHQHAGEHDLLHMFAVLFWKYRQAACPQSPQSAQLLMQLITLADIEQLA